MEAEKSKEDLQKPKAPQQSHYANQDGMLVRKPRSKGLSPLKPKFSKTMTKKERG